MKKYLGVKMINAQPMSECGFINKIKNEDVPSDREDRPGYLVEYEDGYKSWSPKEVFEKAYREISNLTFGLAIEALKMGKKVARAGWNGKGMYLWLLSPAIIKAEWCKESHLREIAESNGGEIEALGAIRMMTADRKILTGWLASQTDMLAEDWLIID